MSTSPPSKPCPICKKPATAKYRPFCSERCAQIDLAKWLGEGYAIPVQEDSTSPVPPHLPSHKDGEES